MPQVAAPGAVLVIHGDTSGNSNTMTITVDGAPAQILAAKPGTVFWRVPGTALAGYREVVFLPGPGKEPVKLPLYVLVLQMTVDHANLIRGQSTRMHVMVAGLDKLPASAWQSELPPSDLVDLKRWAERNSDVRLPKASEPGLVVLVLENQSPETIRMGSRGNRIVLQLHQKDFAKGPYVYEDKLQSVRSGGFDIRGNVTAFLKQVVSRP